MTPDPPTPEPDVERYGSPPMVVPLRQAMSAAPTTLAGALMSMAVPWPVEVAPPTSNQLRDALEQVRSLTAWAPTGDWRRRCRDANAVARAALEADPTPGIVDYDAYLAGLADSPAGTVNVDLETAKAARDALAYTVNGTWLIDANRLDCEVALARLDAALADTQDET